MDELVVREDGLTEAEGEVMDALIAAYAGYCELPEEHPCDRGEFVSAVHRAQDLLAVRIARRAYPAGWARFDADGELID